MSDPNKEANDAVGGRGNDNRPFSIATRGDDQMLPAKSNDIGRDGLETALRAARSK